MTKEEWQQCRDRNAMLAFVQQSSGITKRKARLFAVFCARLSLQQDDERSQAAVEAAERYADGTATPEELVAAGETFRLKVRSSTTHEMCSGWAATLPDAFAAATLVMGLATTAYGILHRPSRTFTDTGKAEANAREKQGEALRDIFNPFYEQERNAPWLTASAVALAQEAYEQRALPSGQLDSGRLAVLADCLEENACADDELLSHLRGPGPHVRGCWAIDFLLKKA